MSRRMSDLTWPSMTVILVTLYDVANASRDKSIIFRNGNVPSDANCTPAAISDFPNDLFTEKQREQGAVFFHFVLGLYCFTLIALVCRDYFLPSVECICADLHLSQDVAGATFMAVATSAPELFVNVVGTFITESDLGIGTIVGSAVFNTLGIVAIAGMAAPQVISLHWWPLTRDCSIYMITIGVLTAVIWDRKVEWYEASVLLLLYFVYFAIMFANRRLMGWTKKLVKWVSGKGDHFTDTESAGTSVSITGSYTVSELPCQSYDVPTVSSRVSQDAESISKDEGYGLASPPAGFWQKLWWFYLWPISGLLYISIPDCRTKKWRFLYPLTFIMCVVWIAISSYIVTWMITVIGNTFQIPDSVMGITLLSAGGSMPEAISSFIMARKGIGSMGISNSLGANTLDILLCLGLPWLIKCLLPGNKSMSVSIISSGLGINSLGLLASVLILYFIVSCFKFKLDKKLGATCLIMFTIFIIFAVLIELNVFFYVNPPVCGW